jgi:hypothetical protein
MAKGLVWTLVAVLVNAVASTKVDWLVQRPWVLVVSLAAWTVVELNWT